MRQTKNVETLERWYDLVGVDVRGFVRDVDDYLIADCFTCRECGCTFTVDANRARNRHRCPYGCNKGLRLR
jgi:hypothetical protein